VHTPMPPVFTNSVRDPAALCSALQKPAGWSLQSVFLELVPERALADAETAGGFSLVVAPVSKRA